jgi:hypothetical protein
VENCEPPRALIKSIVSILPRPLFINVYISPLLIYMPGVLPAIIFTWRDYPMSSFVKKFFYGTVLVLATIVMWGCDQSSPNPIDDITWTAQADGGETAVSTKINFVFNEAVEDLTAAQITVIDDTGSATKGVLAGEGTEWSLGITVIKEGNVIVRINRDGVDSGEKTVAVHEDPIIGWTARADGADGATDSTAIAFTFDKTVAALTADEIEITPITGSVTKAALTGSGTTRSLGITVENAGTVKVKINKAGIEGAEKIVAVHKFVPATYTATADGAENTATSTHINFAFNKAVADLTVDQITLTNDTGIVAMGTLEGNGQNWSLGITVATAGNVQVSIDNAGIEDTEKNVAVHKLVPIAYTVDADGGVRAASTKIDFNFGAAVADLIADQITLTDDTGAVTKGNLTGNGTDWSLGISVVTAGTVKVAIVNPVIEATDRNATVFKPTTYIAGTDGIIDTETSTAIDFTFTEAVEGLTVADISVTGGAGSVTIGELNGSGISWTLGITVETAGTVKFRINRDGIEDAEKTVTAHKEQIVNEDVAFGYTENDSSTTEFDLEEWEPGDANNPGSWTLGAVEKGRVYFTVEKTALQTIAKSGDDADKVTISTEGDPVDGSQPGETLAVVTVATGELPFDGGTLAFTLNVAKDGATSRAINVTLNISANKTGAAAFKVTRPEGQTYNGDMDEAILERVGEAFTGFQAALQWVDANAQADTEYLIRVEQNDTGMVKHYLSFNNTNVIVRLRGDKNGPYTLKHQGTLDDMYYNKVLITGSAPSPSSFTGLFSIVARSPSTPKIFIVGNNITIEGNGSSAYASNMNLNSLFLIHANITLVLEKGSLITGWNSGNVSKNAPIYIYSTYNAGKDPTKHGKIRMEGGGFTNCTLYAGNVVMNALPSALIWVNAAANDASSMAAGSFYKAASTGDNFIFNNNSNNNVFIWQGLAQYEGEEDMFYDLNDHTEEMSIPAE